MSLTNLFISLLTKLILKTQITKTLDWLIYVITTNEKTLNLDATTINLKFQLQLGTISLIFQMDQIHSGIL